MDETDSPQTPDGLIVILAAIADEGIPIQTNCTEVHRAFNKGVDYEGDLDKFKQRIFERRRYPGVCGGRVRTADNLKLSGRALPAPCCQELFNTASQIAVDSIRSE
jgi:tagaturonate epimerase